jgi:hypothetical protein
VVSFKFFVPIIQFLHEGLCHKQSFFQLARIEVVQVGGKAASWVEVGLSAKEIRGGSARHELLIRPRVGCVPEKVVRYCLHLPG